MGADPGYQPMAQNPYQPSPSPHQFMQQHQSGAGQQPGMSGWAPPQQQQQQQQQQQPGGWQAY
jgi:hypothetical protein